MLTQLVAPDNPQSAAELASLFSMMVGALCPLTLLSPIIFSLGALILPVPGLCRRTLSGGQGAFLSFPSLWPSLPLAIGLLYKDGGCLLLFLISLLL